MIHPITYIHNAEKSKYTQCEKTPRKLVSTNRTSNSALLHPDISLPGIQLSLPPWSLWCCLELPQQLFVVLWITPRPQKLLCNRILFQKYISIPISNPKPHKPHFKGAHCSPSPSLKSVIVYSIPSFYTDPPTASVAHSIHWPPSFH